MAVIKSVQSGISTIANTATSTTATLSPSVDLTKSFLMFSIQVNNTRPDDTQISGEITNSTTLTFARIATAGAITIRWYVAEFSSGVTVQRGSEAITGSPPIDVTISAVTLSKSFPIISMAQGGSTYNADDFMKAKITTTTNLELTMVTFDPSFTGPAKWQVVEFTDASVQTGDLSFLTTDLSKTAALSPAVDTSKSLLLFTYTATAGGRVDNHAFRGVVTSSTLLTFDRDDTGTASDVTWYLIEFTDATTVQQASESFTTVELVRNVTLSPSVNTGRSIASAGMMYYRGGKTPYAVDRNPGVAMVTLELTTSTNLQLTRALTGSATTDIGWFVVEFGTDMLDFQRGSRRGILRGVLRGV